MEYVIGTAVMVTLLLVVVQFALYFHLRAVAHTAARHGLDQVRVTEGTTEAGIVATNEFLDQSASSLEDRDVSAQRNDSRSSITVSGTVASVIPGLTLRVDVTVDAPTESVNR